MDHIDYTGIAEENRPEALSRVKADQKKLVAFDQYMAEQFNGLDSITKKSVTLKDDIYTVELTIAFKNGETQDRKFNLRWNEERKDFLIIFKSAFSDSPIL